VHVVAAPAREAQPARDEGVDEDRVADLDIRHAGADLVYAARVLVAGRVQQPDPGLLGPLPLVKEHVVRHNPAAPILTMTSSRPETFGSSTSSSFNASC
jgi:hypothetical protein